MATDILPQDIIFEILLRLPVRSLLRFRTVCSSWLRFISHPDFVSNHQKIASISPHKNMIYVVNGYNYLCKFNSYDNKRLDFCVEELWMSYKFKRGLIGVCNGVVCVGYDIFVIMWNPATRKYKMSSSCKIDVNPRVEGTDGRVCIKRYSHGFAMDASMSDFIYLRIYCWRWDSKLHSVVKVYSSRYDSWKVLEGDFQFVLTGCKNCAIVKGVPYWTAIVRKREDDDKLSEVLLAFDVRHEVFKMVEYPEAALKKGNCAYFVEFNGHLAALVYCPREQCSQLVDVWLLDGDECWNKKFTVGPILMEIERLVGCSGDADILGLDTKHGLFLFLSRNKEIHYIDTHDASCGDNVHNYYETLASVEGMKVMNS